MSSFDAVFKQEVLRLARKVLKQEMAPLRAAIAGQRKQLGQQRIELAELRKQLKETTRVHRDEPAMAGPRNDKRKPRFSAAMCKQRRESLQLTQAQFARLLGVSNLSVWKYEKDHTTPRTQTLQAFQATANLTPRTAAKQLEALG